MRYYKSLLTLPVILLTACSMTLPVRGQVQNANETFHGSATGYAGGSGTLVITTSKGAKCNGNFVYASHRRGEGIFVCDDGRTGPFNFVSTGFGGTGFGDLGGQRFTFTFGN